jgi:hypothetical protein
VAALERAVVVGPRREGGWRPDQPRDHRRLGERQTAGRLAVHVLRHRLDAVDARAQKHAIQIQLQDLPLRQLLFEQQGDDRLLRLAADGPPVRQEQGARQLLRQRAPPLHPPAAARVAEHGAGQADRVDAEMMVEAVILDRDDRVAQRRRDLVERDVVPLLVHPEPRRAVGGVEPGVADAAAQLEDCPSLPHRPDHDDRGHGNETQVQAGNEVSPDAGGHTRHVGQVHRSAGLRGPAPRRAFSTSESAT